jgi:hypothetical protein
MRTVRVTYYGNTRNKKVANFKVKEDDTLELLNTSDYKNLNSSKKDHTPNVTNNILLKKGFGEVVASFTKLFGFKPCAPCNKRRQYLNRITPIFIANIIGKFYK